MIRKLMLVFLVLSLAVSAFSRSNPLSNNNHIYNLAVTDGYRLTYSLTQMWDNNAWVDAQQKIVTYPTENQMVELVQVRDENSWLDMFRYSWTYDDHGNPTEWINEGHFTGSWMQTSRYIFENTYDGNGNLITAICKTDLFGTITNFNKENYTYTNNKLTETIVQMWENNAWVNFMRLSATYGGNGQRSEILSQEWKDNSWVNHTNIFYTYDGNDYLIGMLYKIWENNAWSDFMQSNHTNDANGCPVEVVHQMWENNAWVNSTKNINTYEEATAVEENQEMTNLTPDDFALYNYPNPFNPETTIGFELPAESVVTISVYDLGGRQIKMLLNGQRRAAGAHAVMWDGTNELNRPMASGVYFYRIQTGQLQQTGRCILLK